LVHGVQLDSAVVTGVDPDPRSWVHLRKPPVGTVLGAVQHRSSYRWKYADNPLWPYVQDLASSKVFGVPPTKAFVSVDADGQLVWVDPQAGKFDSTPESLSEPDPMLCDAVVDQWLARIPDLSSLGLVPLTPEQAVFGADGYDAMDLGRSAGMFGKGGLKEDYVDVASKTLKPALEEAVLEILSMVLSDEPSEYTLPVVTS